MLGEFIDGIELTCGVIGNESLQAFPLIEIVPTSGYEFFDYEAKYTPGATREICPARISEAMTEKAQSYAKRAHEALFCDGYSRTDMIMQADEIYILETNTIPGMTATSLFPQAAQAAGYSFTALLILPLVVGFISVRALGGLLAGALVTGFLLAIFMANAGGAWDNAKKFIEAGNMGGKGSEEHKAAVVGDTVGDPLKDTSGPSLNILIKLSAILSLVFAPFFVEYGGILL